MSIEMLNKISGFRITADEGQVRFFATTVNEGEGSISNTGSYFELKEDPQQLGDCVSLQKTGTNQNIIYSVSQQSNS